MGIPTTQIRGRLRSSRTAARRRAAALLFALLAIAIALTLATTFLSAQSTTVAIAGNIQGHAQAKAAGESAAELVAAYVRANPDWRTDHADGTWLTDAPLLGASVTVTASDGLDLDGDGLVVVPAEGDGDLADDALDPITVTATAASGGTTAIARAAVVPTLNANALIGYGLSAGKAPRVQAWSGTDWSMPADAQDVGDDPRWVVMQRCPTRDETALLALDRSQQLTLQVRTGAAWSDVQVLTAGTGTDGYRCMDAAYEQTSGDLLIAYREGAALRYRTYDGATLSAEATLALPGAGQPKWIRLATRPNSNELALITLDDSRDVSASLWNGIAWHDTILLETTARSSDPEGVATAFESVSGRAVLAWTASGVNTFQYRIWDGAAWLDEADGPDLGDTTRTLRAATHPTQDAVVLVAATSGFELHGTAWDGAAWDAPQLLEANLPLIGLRPFDLAFGRDSATALAAWGRSRSTIVRYRTWNAGAWSAQTAGPSVGSIPSIVQLVPGPAAGQVLCSVMTGLFSDALTGLVWDGAALTSVGTIDSGIAGGAYDEAFMVAAKAGIEPPPLEYVVEWSD